MARKLVVKALADALKMRHEELDRLVTADRIRVKFGTIPLELARKNPELEPLEGFGIIYRRIQSRSHRTAGAWAKRDRETVKKR